MNEIIIKVCDKFLEEAKIEGLKDEYILIRCKDCKYYIWEIDMCNEQHSSAHNIVYEDDYCSRAERRE